MLTKNLDGPLDDCTDLTPEQVENMNGWIERFNDKVRMDTEFLGTLPGMTCC